RGAGVPGGRPLRVGGAAGPARAPRAAAAGLASLRSRPWRSAMTVLSVAVGIAVVLVTDAVGRAQQRALDAQLAQLGTNVVAVRPGAATVAGASVGAGSKRTLKDRDVAALRRVEHVVALTPQV